MQDLMISVRIDAGGHGPNTRTNTTLKVFHREGDFVNVFHSIESHDAAKSGVPSTPSTLHVTERKKETMRCSIHCK